MRSKMALEADLNSEKAAKLLGGAAKSVHHGESAIGIIAFRTVS